MVITLSWQAHGHFKSAHQAVLASVHSKPHACSHAHAQVYCTMQHHLVRTITRPSATPQGSAPRFDRHDTASLLFGQNGYIYVSWPDCIKVGHMLHALLMPYKFRMA